MTYRLLEEKLLYHFCEHIDSKWADLPYTSIEGSKESMERLLVHNVLKAISVTTPYTQSLTACCDAVDAKTMFANENKICGDNTMYKGFKYMLHFFQIDVEKKTCFIVGDSLLSKSVYAVLKELDCQIVLVSRQNRILKDEDYQGGKILINCMPISKYADFERRYPLDMQNIKGLEQVIDLVVPPLNTPLILKAKIANITTQSGLLMLIAHCKYAFEFLKSITMHNTVIDKLYYELVQALHNIVLIGMPGSGKSTIGKALAQKMNRTFIDIDDVIEKENNMTISEIINNHGIAYFRDLESQCIQKTSMTFSKVISVGGGAVLKQKNVEQLRYNSKVIYIKRALEALDTKGRPLSQGGLDVLLDMYRLRHPIYLHACDKTVVNTSVSQTVAEVQRIYTQLVF